MTGVQQMSHPTAHEPSSGEIYNRAFWLVFVANLFLCTANTLTFRFAEFITFLGGNEELTGSVVAVGLVASIVWRLFLGQVIDRFGVRNVWLSSTLIYLLGTWLLVATTTTGWEIYAARATYVIGLASMLATALSYVQGLAPLERRTEIIGTYGASGFLGMICGAQLGDLLFKLYPIGTWLFQLLFGLALVMGVIHGVLAIFVTQGMVHVRPRQTPAAYQLIARYWPRNALLVTAMMGLVFAITTVFLTRYATERGISGLRTFFSAYAITAFTMRLAARNWSRIVGRHQLIIYGSISQIFALLALLPVSREWHFIPSAVCFGFGQALLFPCIISLAAGSFPEQYRGTGTTITLSAIDLGTILTAPVLGWMIDNLGFPSMFVGGSLLIVVTTAIYGVLTWRIADSDKQPVPIRSGEPAAARRILLPLATESIPHQISPAAAPAPEIPAVAAIRAG